MRILLLLLLLGLLFSQGLLRSEFPWVDGHRLGAVIRLVDAYQTVGELKHVIAERDNDELSILCALLEKLMQNSQDFFIAFCTTDA